MSGRPYSHEEISIIKREYPTCEDIKALAERMRRSPSGLKKKASQLGLRRIITPVPEKIRLCLISDPLSSAEEIAAKIGMKHRASISTSLISSWGITLTELRREVFEGHWQKIPETAKSLEGNTA